VNNTQDYVNGRDRLNLCIVTAVGPEELWQKIARVHENSMRMLSENQNTYPPQPARSTLLLTHTSETKGYMNEARVCAGEANIFMVENQYQKLCTLSTH
jgi:hypothetical protein